jgi:hypothetical protein
LPREGERIFDPGVQQLSAGGQREGKSRQLPRLQTRQGRDAQEETSRTPKTTSGRVFSFNPIKPNLSFAAALRGQAEIQPQQGAAANYTSTSGTKANEQATGQSVQAPNVQSDSLDMIRAFSVVEQIMAELKVAASEEDKFVALAKIVFKFMKENGK